MALSRKFKKLFAIVLLLLASLFLTKKLTAASPLKIDQLSCEYLQNPLGIDTKTPRLSWTMASTARNQFQLAYEIIVSNKLNEIQQLKGSAWSTGKVLSNQNIHIEYNGVPLQSFTRYFWRVRVYDEKGEPSAWSTVNFFETAMLQQEDWKAKWISDGSRQPVKDEDYYKEDPMPLFRKDFVVNKTIASARLYISGVGYYEAFLNGKKISDHVLDPGWTTYKKEVLYVVHDITSLIKSGNNVTGVMLGNGWWNPLPFKFFGRWDLRNYQQTGRPCVKAEIYIRYKDGTTDRVVTDESWKTAPGPVVKNNVYLGEHYDARKEKENWNLSGSINDWKNSVIVEGPAGVLSAQMQPPIRITKIVKPIEIKEQGKDTFIVDMGQNFAGVARIKLKGPAGKKITLRYGEGLFPNGSINLMTTVATQIKKGGIKGGPGAPETAWQEDSYTLKGEGIEQWSPRFTFHGFRYVEITGWPGTPTLNDIEGLRMNSDLESNGSFSCSNQMFTQLHNAIQWTFLSNVFSVQSDCPGREKMGYGADMVVSSGAYLYNYDMTNFYTKAIRDFANEQQADGGITEIAPFTGIADRGYGGDSGPLGWQLGFSFLQKQLYDQYGDKKIIADYYRAFVKQMNFLQSKAVEGLFHWDISDHEALDPKPEAFTAACFYYHHAMLAQEFAGILNKKEDSLKYSRLSLQIKKAIVRKYLVPKTGRFDNATQSAQIFALWYALSPEDENTFKVLMEEFARHNWHVSSGIFGIKMMFDVLREKDQNEIAYRVANQKDFPGWGYMLENGATTLWESWAFPETGPSRNHPMFGSIDEWFYRSLLGINAAAPGFEKIIIKPQPAGDLSFAKGSYQSVRGIIKSSWQKNGKSFSVDVSIPVNTTAEVWIPAKQNASVIENGNAIKILHYDKGYAVVKVGSGQYKFTTTN
jgi:alpha-L-rhamnosidase